MTIRRTVFKKVAICLLLRYGMFGASCKRDDFLNAAIFHCRFLISSFLAQQKFQNLRNSNADLQDENKHELASKM